MRTVNQIIDELGTIALDHRFINSFKEGEMSEVDIQKLAGNKYPICYADISGASIDKGILTYSLDILVMDMILPGQTDAQEQYSDTLRTLIDIVSQYAQVLSAQSDVDRDVRISLPVDCEPFTARFDNLLTGWVGTVQLQTSNTLDLCAGGFRIREKIICCICLVVECLCLSLRYEQRTKQQGFSSILIRYSAQLDSRQHRQPLRRDS